MPPLIGVSTYNHAVRHGRWEEPAAFAPTGYARALQSVGGSAVLLPSTLGSQEAQLETLFDRIDGLVLTGGYDVCGSAYGRDESEDEHVIELHDPDRDAFEIAATRVAWERATPILAVCRGLQVLNVAFGGTLVADLEAAGASAQHRPTPGAFSPHMVELEPGTLAARVLGLEAEVPSHHHQAIEELAPELRVSGRASDGVIEAAESADQERFALGVQWHPEAGAETALFAALVDACAVTNSLTGA